MGRVLGMMRKRRRLLVEGRSAVYHCISRTACGQFLFDELAREVFVKILRKQAGFCGVEVLSFCVMSNHFHVLVRVPEAEEVSDGELLRRYRMLYGGAHCPASSLTPAVLEQVLLKNDALADQWRQRLRGRMHDLRVFMRELKQRFGIWYNRRHENRGTIWADRYTSVLVEDEAAALATVAAYIDLNPLRAKMVNNPAEYRFSSYGRAVAGERVSRSGYAALYGTREGWAQVEARYNRVVFGKGAREKGTIGKDTGVIAEELVQRVLAEGGRLSRSEVLRVRVRYFSAGAALGSREYLEELGRYWRDTAGLERKRNAYRMKGADWEGLCSFRNLQVRPLG